LIIYELFWGVGPIYISRPEIIFVDFVFFATVEITTRSSGIIMAHTYGFEGMLVVYELCLRVGPIHISRPEIIFVDFRFCSQWRAAHGPAARLRVGRSGRPRIGVCCTRAPGQRRCVQGKRCSQSGVGGGVNLRCVPATRGEGEVVSTYPAGLPK
jgi:hypothetical protein